ncbi:MAG TPA: YqhA family protein [Rhizobiaceae bacterium]|nr:YqhA family protein [Rhizobiaceae bacterium]
MNFRQIERNIIVASRFFTVLAAIGALAGSLLMFLLGLVSIYRAYQPGALLNGVEPRDFSIGAVINVIEALDRFLIGMVLLYFAYGVYSLFIHPGEPKERIAIPDWLRVREIGQLKQVVADLILVIIFVLFLRAVLETFSHPRFAGDWLTLASLALLPLSGLLLALALRLVELHPKPERPRKAELDDDLAADQSTGAGEG